MISPFQRKHILHDIFGNALYTIDIGQKDFTLNLGSLSVKTVKPYSCQPNLLGNTGK